MQKKSGREKIHRRAARTPAQRLRLGCTGAAGAGLALGLWLWLLGPIFALRPPAGGEELQRALATPRVVEADGTTHVGECYAFRRQGLRACFLTGTPFQRGVAMARFFPRELAALESSLLAGFRQQVPNPLARWLLTRYWLIRNRRLGRYLPRTIQAEISGLAAASDDLFPQYGQYYTRLVNYLAAQDFSRGHEPPGAGMGCTAFGSTGSETADGRPLLARNFDFPAGGMLDWEKLVILVKPRTGHAYLTVAWPGMFGVVSGMNDAGLAIVLLAGHSSDRSARGAPVSVVARRALQEAGTLEEAVDMIREAEIFVSESFFIGSGAENAFVVVEKTPLRTAVRRKPEAILMAGNHFLTPELEQDPVNARFRREDTSAARLTRLRWLLNQDAGQLDIARCVRILRDTRGPEGEVLGLGNRLAINALIAAHAVVFDLGRKVAWVSVGPHALGAFVPFALNDFAAEPSLPSVPADPLLTGGQYAKYVEYHDGIQQGERLLRGRRYQEALSWLLEVRPLNLTNYRSYLLAGRALRALGRADEARYNYELAASYHPAYLREREEVQTALQHLQGLGP